MFEGIGNFWVSLYNPSLVHCNSAISCEGKLRNAFGQVFETNALSIEFQITGKRCLQLVVNSTINRFESKECDVSDNAACESACALGSAGVSKETEQPTLFL